MSHLLKKNSEMRYCLGIRAWLFALPALAVLPILLFSLVSVFKLADNRQQAVEAMLPRRATGTAKEIERQLNAKTGTLFAMGQNDLARQGDLAGLYAYTQRVLSLNPDVLAFTFIDREGRQLFSTLRPFGEPLPPSGDIGSAAKVIDQRQPVVSGAFVGSVSRRPVISLGVPVEFAGKGIYCLRMILEADSFAKMLGQQGLAPDWSATLFDSSGAIIASTLESDSPALTSLHVKTGQTGQQSEPSQDVFVSLSRNAKSNKSAQAEVGDWGWVVNASVPMTSLRAPLYDLLWSFGIGGTICMSIGFAAVIWLSRKLAGEVAQISVVPTVPDHEDEAEPSHPPYGAGLIREIGQVSSALREAASRAQQASLDDLTRLPGRTRFSEQATAVQCQCMKEADLRLAVMFVDLDSFKQVNDKLGHEAGDKVLVDTAAVLRASVRETDALGRLGGDEFAVCLAVPGLRAEKLLSCMAERILRGIRGLEMDVGASIGIAMCPAGAPDLGKVMASADAAMYEAKRLGKNRFTLCEVDGPDAAGAPAPDLHGQDPSSEAGRIE